jgi:threonine/homoserine/homoserine lactone efflux protein
MMPLVPDIAVLRGFLAGFALAAPLGPVAVLCIRRVIAKGRVEGFLTGLGAAVADTTFGAVAGLGMTYIIGIVKAYETAIGLVGGAIVLIVGILAFRAPVSEITSASGSETLRRDALSAFTMGITNPATMLGAVGIFAAFGRIDYHTHPIRAFWLVAGVFSGSATWWVVLAMIAGKLKAEGLTPGLRRLNHLSGGIITVSGVAVLGTAIYRLLIHAH